MSDTSRTSLGKRKLADSDSPLGPGDRSSLKVAKQTPNDDIRPKVLACPYWKHDREKYRLCCKLSHKRIRDVKQHLHRRHTPDIYCDRCLEVFDNAERYETHVHSRVACFRTAGSQLEGIDKVQSRALSKKSKRNLGEEDQWFAMWDILFPGVARPASAYADSELTEEMNSFQEYWTNRGRDILMDELNSSDIWVLSPDQRETQGRQILSRGLNSIYEQWNDSRRNASIAQAATDMLISPPVPSTATSSSDFTPNSNSYAFDAIQAPANMPDQEGLSSATAVTTQGGGMPERDQSENDEFDFLDSRKTTEATADTDFSLWPPFDSFILDLSFD
ncbi:hypothetical protein KJ359_006007 [Pestalotiopsis sp. 9143b]|nr:hypothetical protein KJ359_006007 [Pestalotiopsis sp. 9143b]